MATTQTNPDVPYIRTREDLIQYIDARENSLLQAMANFYVVRNNQSIIGTLLSAVSEELANYDYGYNYDLVNKNPIFLTPPDIKRRWAANLYINRLYPTLSPVQYDLNYKQMLAALVQAYREGSTTAGIEAVINAYTGLDIQVIELYKYEGQGGIDVSDGNSIRVSINVGGSDPLTNVASLNQLQAITTALYTAIDLAKPAHVGLEFTTVFGADENIDAYVTAYDAITNPLGIQDTLRIYIREVETGPFDPMLWQAPDLLPTTPRTGIAPVSGWPVTSVYNRGMAYTLTQSILDTNNFVQQVTTAGTSYPAWQQNHAYSSGVVIVDQYGNLQQVTNAGTSGSGHSPNFTSIINATTNDNTVIWTCIGQFAFNQNVGGTTNDGTVVWTNQGVAPGLVAPRINQAWEISSDSNLEIEPS